MDTEGIKKIGSKAAASAKGVGGKAVDGVKEMATGYRNHGIQHVAATVSNFDNAVSWYHEMFDFYLVSDMDVPGDVSDKLAELYGRTGLTIRLGFLRSNSGTVLEIFEISPEEENTPTVWNRPGYTHMALSVTNVPALKAELESKGVKFLSGVEFMGGAHWAFCQDPDGNLIELIDFHANRLPLQHLGGVLGRVLKRGKYAKYYR